MINIHVISDLYLGFVEFTDAIDETLPNCQIVVIVGNIAQIKRTMLYVETLCKKYPDRQFVLNVGRVEDGLHQKNTTELSDGLTARQEISEFWPKNLHYAFQKPIILNINGKTLSIFCFHGFPHIMEDIIDSTRWKGTAWYKYATHGVTIDENEFKNKNAANIYHGWFPKFSTPERCRQDHYKEQELAKEWLSAADENHIKVLVTALHPKNDPCLSDIDYIMYPDISPDVWIASGVSGETRTNNTIIYGNPGRSKSARESVLTI
jgi:hypothetical protein